MNNEKNIEPAIGMGVTICYWSDRIPGTIVQISSSKKTIFIQEDYYQRIDNNGLSESQEYQYSRNIDGAIHTATRRKDGSFRISKSKTLVALGHRRKFYDFSF